MKVLDNCIFWITNKISNAWHTISSLIKENVEQDPCQLGHIPPRLKRGNRSAIEVFEVEEELYRRCKKEFLDNPFTGISLCELSHNRQGLSEDILCEPDDVLFDITGKTERHNDLEVCKLRIISLTPENTFQKLFQQQKNGEDFIAEMQLLHDPDDCMYPHSVFRVSLNGTIVTIDNYKTTLNKCPEIKTRIKEELAAMIIRRVVDQNGSPVIFNKLESQ